MSTGQSINQPVNLSKYQSNSFSPYLSIYLFLFLSLSLYRLQILSSRRNPHLQPILILWLKRQPVDDEIQKNVNPGLFNVSCYLVFPPKKVPFLRQGNLHSQPLDWLTFPAALFSGICSTQFPHR